MKSIVRTHDVFYLKENRYKKPKQLHMDIIESIKKTMGEKASAVICDFGCAAGEFAYALREIFPEATIEGYDLLGELIAKAIHEVPNVEFHVGSITDRLLCKPNRSDYTLCTGVLSIFDSFEPIIENLLYWTKPGGRVFLHGLFNNYPVDVNIKYNLSADYASGSAEAGWNIFSKKSVSTWLQSHVDVATYNFSDFHIEVDLDPQDDPVRSWTIKDENKNRLITNGLCLIQPHSILQITKK